MTFFPDMGTVTMVAAGPHVRAVGWLEPDHDFPKGDAPPGFVRRLREFSENWGESSRLLELPSFLGNHSCDFCGNASGSGNFGVPSGEILFVAPALVVHYVEAHRYLPPPEFVMAVMNSPAPGTWRYRSAIEPFRGLPISPQDQERIGEAMRAWVSRARTGWKS